MVPDRNHCHRIQRSQEMRRTDSHNVWDGNWGVRCGNSSLTKTTWPAIKLLPWLPAALGLGDVEHMGYVKPTTLRNVEVSFCCATYHNHCENVWFTQSDQTCWCLVNESPGHWNIEILRHPLTIPTVKFRSNMQHWGEEEGRRRGPNWSWWNCRKMCLGTCVFSFCFARCWAASSSPKGFL